MGTVMEDDVEGLEDEGVDKDDKKDDDKPEKKEEKKEESTVYGDTAPAALRGKTMEEGAALFNELESAATALSAKVRATAETPAPAAKVEKPEPITQDDLLGDDPNVLQTKLDKMVELKVQPFLEKAARDGAMETRRAAYEAYPVLGKFQSETSMFEGQMNMNQATDPGSWARIAQHLTSKHFGELAKEHTEKTEKPDIPFTEGVKSSETKEAEVTATPEEKRIAKLLDVNIKDYLAFKPSFAD